LGERGKGGSQDGKYTAREYRRRYKYKLKTDPEEIRGMLDTKVSMNGTHDTYSDSKHSKINTNPLERYLRSRVGDDWDQVYSDIKEKTKNYWAGGYSCNGTIDDLMRRFLITDTYMEGDVLMSLDYLGRPCNIWKCYWGPFYVDPRDKTLQVLPTKAKWWRYRHKLEPNKDRYMDSNNPLVQYHKISGQWYEIKLRDSTQDETERRQFGAYVKECGREQVWSEIYGSQIVNSILWSQGKIPRGCSVLTMNENLWLHCHKLFKPAYWDIGPKYSTKDKDSRPNLFPLSKRQPSTKETRQVLKLIEERDKDD